MSAEAVGWVYRHSPYTGATFTVHLAVADSANDQHGYELWARQKWIAGKARCSRQTVNRALAEMVDDGMLQVVENRRHAPNRYRLLMPDVDPEWTPEGVARDDTSDGEVSRETTPGVARDDTKVSRETTQNPKGRTQGENPKVKNVAASGDSTSTNGDTPAVDFPDVSTETTRDHARQLCRTMAEEMRDATEHAPPKPGSSSVASWLKTMERLVRIGPSDDRDWPDPDTAAELIEAAIMWIYRHDTFWRGPVQSPNALRKHWGRIRTQMMDSDQVKMATKWQRLMADAERGEL